MFLGSTCKMDILFHIPWGKAAKPRPSWPIIGLNFGSLGTGQDKNIFLQDVHIGSEPT